MADDSISTDFTSTIHRTSYPAISPTKPSLNQAGKTVLITGGGTGIGKAIAHNFVLASAANVVIIGRRQSKLDEAAGELEAAGKQAGKTVNIIARTCDVTDNEQVQHLWDSLAMHVDVLVLNAAIDSPAQTMFELGTAAVWAQFEANVKGPLQFAEAFYKQSNPAKSKKYLINMSSAVIHFRGHPLFDPRPTYSLTKTSGTLSIQMLADSISVDEMQILSIHPGMMYTEPVKAQGVPEDAFPFDDVNLAGSFAVWAASKEASFLHGRYVWAAWDVEELAQSEIVERLEKDRDYLKISVKGLAWGKKT